MIRLRVNGARWASESRYDAVIYSSIAFTAAGLPGWLKRKAIARSAVLIYWDFFPIHQKEIGHLSRPVKMLEAPLHAIEQRAVCDADIAFTMSPRNEDFFRGYFPSSQAQILQTPPWGALMPDSPAWDSPRAETPFTAVFGGQLTSGRGIEMLPEAAHIVYQRDSSIMLRVFGDGPLRPRLEDEIRRLGLANTEVMGNVSREEYQQALSRAHVGLAITVPNVSVPTYPSKIIDYCRAGLPVVVAVEDSGDAGEALEASGAGMRIPAGDAAALANAILHVQGRWIDKSWAEASAASRRFFLEELTVDVTVARITQAVAEIEGAG